MSPRPVAAVAAASLKKRERERDRARVHKKKKIEKHSLSKRDARSKCSALSPECGPGRGTSK